MNLRKVTLRYLGWCPGVKAAAGFFPEREISKRFVVLSTVIFMTILISGVALAQYYMRPLEPGPLKVTIYDIYDPEIEPVTYPDDIFDESFNYSKLRDKHIEFNNPFKSEFSTSGNSETQIYEFEWLEDVWLLLEELETPRIVIGFTKWLANGTFEDIFVKFHGYHPSERGEWSGPPEEISLLFGRWKDKWCHFEVIREPAPGSYIPAYVTGIDGIYVEMRYSSHESSSSGVWTIYIKMNDAPPFSTVLIRHPFHASR
jgi:hypothetical protein